MSDINDRILRNRRNHLASKPNRTRAEEAELNTISAELDAADALLRPTDTSAEYRPGEQSASAINPDGYYRRLDGERARRLIDICASIEQSLNAEDRPEALYASVRSHLDRALHHIQVAAEEYESE